MTDEMTWEDRRDAELAANTAEVARADEVYMTGATGTDVQDDLDDRVAEANATHTAVQNEDDGTTLNQTDNAEGMPTYTGGNVVDDESPTEFSTLVRTALDGDALFDTGGQIPPDDYLTSSSVSPYVDGLWLAEASKMTGEKHF